MARLEASLQRALVRRLKEAGCLVFKWESPGHAGVPDLIVIKPGGAVHFVELKSERGRLSPLQEETIRRLKAQGANVEVIYGEEGIRMFLAQKIL